MIARVDDLRVFVAKKGHDMFKFKTATSFLACFGCAVLLTACGPGGKWKTDYADVISTEMSADWRISSVEVAVPETLSVSEENTFAPDADIVWRGESVGNRYEQVDAIITEAAERGSSGLTGGRSVRLEIEVQQFHALTEKTRFTLQQSGVHNIRFVAQVFDAKTGAPLSIPDSLQADLIGLSGAEAVEAIGLGQTQRVRIIDHVSKVIAGWLGHGPDIRGRFSRAGR